VGSYKGFELFLKRTDIHIFISLLNMRFEIGRVSSEMLRSLRQLLQAPDLPVGAAEGGEAM
jgi:hypothetical protein